MQVTQCDECKSVPIAPRHERTQVVGRYAVTISIHFNDRPSGANPPELCPDDFWQIARSAFNEATKQERSA